YFSSDRGDAGNYDLFTAGRVAADGGFGAPSLLPLVSTPSAEFDPSVTGEGTTLYFASDRPGGVGGFDVYVATRPNLVSEFANAAPVANVNGPTFDAQPFVREDGAVLYFASDRGGGSYDLYRAT